MNKIYIYADKNHLPDSTGTVYFAKPKEIGWTGGMQQALTYVCSFTHPTLTAEEAQGFLNGYTGSVPGTQLASMSLPEGERVDLRDTFGAIDDK